MNEVLVGSGAPSLALQKHYAAPGGRPVYLTYGSDQGAACWSGAIRGGEFSGAIDDLGVFNFELAASEGTKASREGTKDAH